MGRCRLATYSSETDHTRPGISIHASCLAVLSSLKKRKVSVAQLYLALCNPMDCSPSGPSVQGILQARTL